MISCIAATFSHPTNFTEQMQHLFARETERLQVNTVSLDPQQLYLLPCNTERAILEVIGLRTNLLSY